MSLKSLFPAPKLIVIAALAGVAAGAVAVYFNGGPSGNRPAAATTSAAAEAADAACVAKADRAKALAAMAIGEVAAMLPADPPQSLAALTFEDPAGQAMTLADRAGRTVLVNLWATWCAPCRAEMPALDALQRDKGSDRFEVVTVNVDTGDAEKPRKFLSEIGVSDLALYRDPTMGIFNDLKKRGLALGLPVTLLVDGEGCLLAHMNGPAEWSSADAGRLIDAALAP